MMTIQEILRLFGITRCYKGFKHIEFSVALAVSEEERLEAVTKENLHGDRFPFQLQMDCGGTQHPNCHDEGVESQPSLTM